MLKRNLPVGGCLGELKLVGNAVFPGLLGQLQAGKIAVADPPKGMLQIAGLPAFEQIGQLPEIVIGVFPVEGAFARDNALHAAHPLIVSLVIHCNKVRFPDALLLIGMGILRPDKILVNQLIQISSPPSRWKYPCGSAADRFYP